MSLKRVQQWATFARIWHVYNAAWQNPFHSAEIIKKYLLGTHKPIYHPLNDCGDHVIVINTADIALTEEEWKKRAYFHHTGYPGGASWTLAWDLHTRDRTMIIKKAVYRSMDGNLQRHHLMQRLHLFEGDNVPAELMGNVSSQIKQLRPMPKRLDHYDEEEVKKFPKLIDYPKDYILR